jgi:hypothetical protein
MREAVEAAAQQVEEVLGASDLWVNNAMSRRGAPREARSDRLFLLVSSNAHESGRVHHAARRTAVFPKDLRATPDGVDYSRWVVGARSRTTSPQVMTCAVRTPRARQPLLKLLRAARRSGLRDSP